MRHNITKSPSLDLCHSLLRYVYGPLSTNTCLPCLSFTRLSPVRTIQVSCSSFDYEDFTVYYLDTILYSVPGSQTSQDSSFLTIKMNRDLPFDNPTRVISSKEFTLMRLTKYLLYIHNPSHPILPPVHTFRPLVNSMVTSLDVFFTLTRYYHIT